MKRYEGSVECRKDFHNDVLADTYSWSILLRKLKKGFKPVMKDSSFYV